MDGSRVPGLEREDVIPAPPPSPPRTSTYFPASKSETREGGSRLGLVLQDPSPYGTHSSPNCDPSGRGLGRFTSPLT